LEGLEISEISLSAYRQDNSFFRLDSEFSEKEAAAYIQKLRSIGASRFGDSEPTIIHPNEITRSYVEEGGVWFFRAQNLRALAIADDDKVFVSEKDAASLSKNWIENGDVVITRTGANAGDCALFDSPERAVASSHTFIVRSKSWSHPYLVAFLNSKYGRTQILRARYGAAQPEVAPYYLRGIWIPKLGPRMDVAIAMLFRNSQQKRREMQVLQAAAEQTLLRALGLEGWEPPEPLTYTRRASEALAAARLDAEYFAPRVAQLLAKLGADGLTIGEVAPARHEAFDPKAPQARPIPAQGNALGIRSHKEQALKGRLNPEEIGRPDGASSSNTPDPRAMPWAGIGQAVGLEAPAVAAETFQYIEISGLRSDGTATGETTLTAEAPSRASQKVHANDIITSTVRPIRRLSAIVSPAQHGHVCSSGFVVLNPTAIAPEVLLTYLRLPAICELMDLHTSASLYPAISERDILALPIPRIPDTAGKAIISQIRSAHAARQEAQSLLERAKRAVEVAIEEGEAAGMAMLK
jgi:hypothetical protein